MFPFSACTNITSLTLPPTSRPASTRLVHMTEIPQPIKVGVSKVSILQSCRVLAPSSKTSKSKAKARYLKRKKLRRKARKSSAPRKPEDAPHASSESEEDEEHHDDQERIVDEVENEDPNEERVIAREEPIQPPRKKRRVVQDGSDPDVGVPEDTPDSENKELPNIQKPPAIPTGTLPSFPLPTAPRAPPKSVLAMQGIDKALVHAEVIDPAAVIPLSTAEHDPYDCDLSLKTRRRLLDLGISELFAGQG